MRYVGAGALCALLLAGCGGEQTASEGTSAASGAPTAQVAPAATRAPGPDAGGLAALQAGRDARISVARSAWSEALAEHPDQTGDYVVSFVGPVYLTEFLAAGSSGVTLGTLHLWLNDDRSLFPMAGEAPYATLPQATEDAVAALTERYDPILTRKVAQAKTNAGRADTEEKARAQREHRYIVAAQKDLNANGPRMYGFTCTCSPAAVERLAKASGAEIRLVETADARSANGRPMYPYDRQLEQALASSPD